jgi:hypothetical protein
MPDQSLVARRQAELSAEIPHWPVGQPAGTTQAQLAQAANLAGTLLTTMDIAYGQFADYIGKGGRTYPHQRYIEGIGGQIFNEFEMTAFTIYQRRLQDIAACQSQPQVRTEYRYIHEPRRGILGRLLGG